MIGWRPNMAATLQSRTSRERAQPQRPARRARRPIRRTKPNARGRCRTNSRHGLTDPRIGPIRRSSRCAGRSTCCSPLNKLRIASVTAIHEETGFPKSTIVRMLETLRAEGYVARDNMCGGYRVTSRVQKLNVRLPGDLAAHRGGAAARHRADPPPQVADRHRRHRRRCDRDQVLDRARSAPGRTPTPCSGLRPDLLTTAMGRAYLAFCSAEERDRHLRQLRADPRARLRRGRGTRVPRAARAGAPRRLRDPRSAHQAVPHDHAGGADPRRRDRARAGQHQHLHDGRPARQGRRADRRAACRRRSRADRARARVLQRPLPGQQRPRERGAPSF